MLKAALAGLLLLGAICLGPIRVAGAQDVPSGIWWHHPLVVRQLALTKTEIAALDRSYRASRRGLLEQKIRVEKARLELDAALEQQELNATTARARFEELEAARADLARERFDFVVDIRKLLGHERFLSLKHLQSLLQGSPGEGQGNPGVHHR